MKYSKTLYVFLSAAVVTTSVFSAGVSAYATDTGETTAVQLLETLEETESSKETEMPEETEAPKETEASEETEMPKEMETSEETEAPKETEASEETEAPKETETSEETEAPKETETSEETEAPKETETSEETEAPKETETSEEAEAPEIDMSYSVSAPFIAIGDRIRYNVELPIEGIPSFITQEMIVGALKAQDETGYPASVTIAQIIQESGFGSYGPGGEEGKGLSYLAYQYCNLFGIKGSGTAGSAFMNTFEMNAEGEIYYTRAGFRAYHTYTELFRIEAGLSKICIRI